MKKIFTPLITFLFFSGIAAQAVDTRFSTNKIKFGDTWNGGDKTLEFDNDTPSTNPRIKGSSSAPKLSYSIDGTNYKSFPTGAGGAPGYNLADQGDFEASTTTFSSVGTASTFTVNTTAANLGEGLKAAAFNAVANNDIFRFEILASKIPLRLQSKPCVATFNFKGGDALLSYRLTDGTGALISGTSAVAMSTAALYTASTPIPFTCPSTGSLRWEIISTGNAAVVYVDNLFVGEQVSSGSSGGGGINYVQAAYRDAETGLSGWATYNDGAAAAPVDGLLGTASSLTLSATTTASEILNGTKSYKLVKSATNAQGQGVSVPFQIPIGYRGKKARVAFKFKVLSGSLVEGDIKGFVFQHLDGIFSPSDIPLEVGKLVGSQGEYVAYFDAKLGGVFTDQYLLALHFASTSTTAVTIAFDDVSISDQQVAYGMAGSDFQSYTPTFTGFGTVSSQDFKWRRVGDSVEVEGRWVSGTATATEARVSLPPGLVAASDYSTLNVVGSGAVSDAVYVIIPLIEPSATYLAFGRGGSAANGYSKRTGSDLTTSGTLSVFARIRVAGWSSNVQLGESASFKISSYLASGARVTAAPAKLGEWRSQLRQASGTTYSDTNGTPSTLPTFADGLRLYVGNQYTATDNTGQPTRYEIFVGKNKNVKFEFYGSSGRSGYLDTSPVYGTTVDYGYLTSYNPSTGIASINGFRFSGGTATHQRGFTETGATATDGYFDIVVSENALMVGASSVRSEVSCTVGNGHGSTNTKVRRFANSTSTGTAITYADSATAGASFTINEDGIYAITYSDRYSAGGFVIGVSRNSSQLTTSIESIAAADRASIAYTATADTIANAPVAGINLKAGDVIRAHTQGQVNNTDAYSVAFRITKVNF